MRSQHRKELRALMFQLYEPWKKRPKAEVLAELRAVNVPSGAVNNLGEVFADPQVQHRGVAVTLPHPISGEVKVVANPIRMSATPVAYDRPPPLRGQRKRRRNDSIGRRRPRSLRLRRIMRH